MNPIKQTIKRNRDWEKRMYSFIESRQSVPMQWGKSDCYLLAIDHVLNITGVNLDAVFSVRGKYRTMSGALRLIKKHTNKTIGQPGAGKLIDFFSFVAQQFNLKEVSSFYGCRGDVALFNAEAVIGGRHDIIGVVVDHRIVAQGETGLVFIDLSQAKKVWQI